MSNKSRSELHFLVDFYHYKSYNVHNGGKGAFELAAANKLTGKMLSFIDAYFGEAQFNATEAYRLSGYKITSMSKATLDKNVSELMAKPLIIAEIERRQAARQVKAEVKSEYLINKLMQIIEKEQEDNPQAALRAIELAGKSIALWKERQEISGVDGEAIKHEQHVKESVADFTDRIKSLASRAASPDVSDGASNVVRLPDRRAEG